MTSRWCDWPVEAVRRALTQTEAQIRILEEQAARMRSHLNVVGFEQATKQNERQKREGAHRAA